MFLNKIIKNIILHESQYGIRKVRSASMALLNLMENITTSLDNKMCMTGGCTDLVKSFDTIYDNILLKKMNHYDINGVISDCIYGYLSNWKQFVYLNIFKSNLKTFHMGFHTDPFFAQCFFNYNPQ